VIIKGPETKNTSPAALRSPYRSVEASPVGRVASGAEDAAGAGEAAGRAGEPSGTVGAGWPSPVEGPAGVAA
jgi:hypothetical protein